MSGYSNVLVKGATREALLDYLNRHNISSYVSPSANGMTVVYPEEQTPDWLADMTRWSYPAFVDSERLRHLCVACPPPFVCHR
jgi:hypothetical protein